MPTAKRGRIEPKSKVWIEVDGKYLMGDGRAMLLEEIDRHGSISGAARRLEMSYRHAWGYIRKIEERFGMKVVETKRGGRDGGQARLTRQGRRFLHTYHRFREAVSTAIGEQFRQHFGARRKVS